MISLRASAVIITYNSALDIDACLRALIPTTFDLLADVIVVDNASVDETLSLIHI